MPACMKKSRTASEPRTYAVRKVLVIAPHPDDETIGCGGLLLRHAAAGDRLTAVFLTSGELGLKHLPRDQARALREKEARQAARILNISTLHFLRVADWSVGDAVPATARRLAPILRQEFPRIIYVPHPEEWHPDHRAALPVLRAALKTARTSVEEIRAYEVWTPMTTPEMAEDVTAVMPRKIKALRAHRSQLKEFNYLRAMRGLNAFRGELAAKCRYAEVFRWIEAVPPSHR